MAAASSTATSSSEVHWTGSSSGASHTAAAQRPPASMDATGQSEKKSNYCSPSHKYLLLGVQTLLIL